MVRDSTSTSLSSPLLSTSLTLMLVAVGLPTQHTVSPEATKEANSCCLARRRDRVSLPTQTSVAACNEAFVLSRGHVDCLRRGRRRIGARPRR